ncbi:MAG: hypothetical protein EOP55_13750, partial [Sphingobacteriales bacterium]
MSVTLLNAPSVISFSGDYINAEFECTGFLQQTGVKAVNTLSLADNIAAGVTKTIKYGNKTIVMVSAVNPDDSGLQFKSGSGAALPGADVVQYFQNNPYLSEDFDIDFAGFNIVFTAKEKTLGFNFATGNTTPGIPDIVKPNYTVFFKLYLENATHTGYDLIFKTNLQLRFGEGNKAIAQLDDKLSQKIVTDMDRLGLEIPTNTALECKTTSRKYYFEFAESYGETIAVKKLHRSATYNVIDGGLSFQAKATQSVASLLSPGVISSDRFLKQGSTSQKTREDQPQFLYFYNTRATKANVKLYVYHYFSNGTNGDVELYTVNLDQYKKLAFNVSPGNVYTGDKELIRYDIWLIDANGDRISEKQYFFIDRTPQNFARYFLNWSSWGGFDSRCFTGKATPGIEVDYQKANRFLKKGYRIENGNAKIFGKTAFKTFAANTGFSDKANMFFWEDLFLSRLAFRYVKNTLLPIEITSKSIEFTPDGDYLYFVAFDYAYLFN